MKHHEAKKNIFNVPFYKMKQCQGSELLMFTFLLVNFEKHKKNVKENYVPNSPKSCFQIGNI